MKQVKSGIILSYLNLMAANIITLILTPVMLSKIGESHYGALNFATAIINYILIFEVGIGTTAIKYFTKLRIQNKRRELERVTGVFFLINCIVAIIILIVGATTVFTLDTGIVQGFNLEEINVLKNILVFLFIGNAIMLPLSIFEYLLFSYEEFIAFKVSNLLRTAIVPLVTLVLVALDLTNSVISITLINMVLINVVRIGSLIYCVRVKKHKIRFGRVKDGVIRDIVIHVSFVFLGMAADKILWNTDQIIVGVKFASSYVVLYSLAINISKMFINLNGIIGEFNTAHLTRVVVEKNKKKLSNSFIKLSRIYFIISTYVYFGFVVAGKTFVDIWVGRGYTEVYYIALIIITGMYISASDNVGSKILKLKGTHKFQAYVKFTLAVINIPTTIFLINKVGLLGGALSTLFIYSIPLNIIMNIYYKKYVSLDVIRLFKELLRIFTPTVLIAIFINLTINKLEVLNIIKISLVIIVFTILYGINIYLFVLKREEREGAHKHLRLKGEKPMKKKNKIRYIAKVRRWLALKKMNFAIIVCRKKGTRIGEGCRLTGVPNLGSEPYLIRIGNNVTLTHGVKFLTHDAGIRLFSNEKEFSNINKFGKIEIKDNCMIGANTIILPSVTIGPNSIVGAGSVVSKDVMPNSVYAGNPARFICSLEEYKEKCKKKSLNLKKINEETLVKHFFE
ncbi:DapH/DapD/GlmU-related protein [Clostridium sp.]|uniref:DapH/DapD/GlmU-related protein n=1 Tax=Clostridium sp. TaxID=1506 RepID=UPI003F4121A0